MKEKFNELYNTAIVTGAAGFIGSHIVEELISYGIKTIAIDDFSAGHKRNLDFLQSDGNLMIVDCDVSNYEAMSDYFKDVDIVFHNAASKKNICLIDPARDLDVNARGTLNVMLLAKKYGIKKIVHASTGSVYGEPIRLPLDETHPLEPTSYYGVSKLAGERYVDVFHKLYNINTTILRYFHVFGPRQESHPDLGGVVAIFIRNIRNNKDIQIHGDGNQLRSFTFVKDIVTANILAAIEDSSNGQVYNVASGIKVTINDLVEVLKSEKHLRDYDFNIKYTQSLVGDIKYFDIDNKKIRSLGVIFTNFNDALRVTINSKSND
jgi:UDP-glucose 4-epimerase